MIADITAADKKTEIDQDHMSLLFATPNRLVGELVEYYLTDVGNFDINLADSLGKTYKLLNDNGRFDIVMMDFSLPGMVGLDGLRQILHVKKDTNLVLLSTSIDHFTLDRLLEIGVRGIISKSMPLKSFKSALDLVQSGEVFIPWAAVESKEISLESTEKLSNLEMFVLRLAAGGLTNKHIAADTNQTETSVKMHMRAICRKLGARNRAHAAVIARDLNILEK